MATPAVREIRKFLPETRITLLAHPRVEGFWSVFPGMDRVIPLSTQGPQAFWRQATALRAEGFDAALLFPTSLSSAFLFFTAQIPNRIGWSAEGRDLFLTRSIGHDLDRRIHLVWDYLDLARKAFNIKRGPSLYRMETGIENAAKRQAAQLLGNRDSGGVIALGPGAAYGPAKRWPLEYWKDLIGLLLTKRKETLVVLGTAEEKAFFAPLSKGLNGDQAKRLLDLAGQTDVKVLTALLSQCRLLITNDSGPMHLAAAVRTPVVGIFGSTSPLWTGPFGSGHSILTKNLDCSPCFQKTCPIGYPCLREISAEEVFGEAEKRLREKNRVTGAVPPKGVGR